MNFISQLRERNPLLFWFGLFNLLTGIICLILIPLDEMQILGVSRWLKPAKFYLSVGLMILTMGWLLNYLNNAKKIRQFSRWLVISMFFENGLILLQAIRGTTSHFNIKTPFDGVIFSLMGIFILIFTITCILICISFFRQKQFNIPDAYVWGIRLGLLFFIIFSIEGGMMLSLLKHTVGGEDGGPGLPVVNWSKQYGDLRIAHFFGIHSLQILPIIGCNIAKTKRQIILLSLFYFILMAALFFQALNGIPLFF